MPEYPTRFGQRATCVGEDFLNLFYRLNRKATPLSCGSVRTTSPNPTLFAIFLPTPLSTRAAPSRHDIRSEKPFSGKALMWRA